jgi:peroxiredoxin
MNRERLGRLAAAALAATLCGAAAARPQPLAGVWDASIAVNGAEVPFRMEISGDGASVKGAFFNGDEKVTSTRGRFDGASLVLDFDQYATKLEARLADGRLEGRYDRGPRGFYAFRAKRFVAAPIAGTSAPSIAGLWNVQVQSSKGESAWRLIVRQSGPEVSATILRVDGDTGTLTGTYKDGVFTLSHFSGSRPSLFELRLQPDGSLKIVQKGLTPPGAPAAPNAAVVPRVAGPTTPVDERGEMRLVAVRSDDPRAASLPQPSDPSRFTSVADPTQPLRFSFPDLEGRLVSNTDPRFAGKVLLVLISGSWCPNCHDEAPFLTDLYRTYKSRGLEIVALSFEEPDQLPNPVRLRAFVKEYRIDYPVLVAGKPDDVNALLPQAVNLFSFPTTFLIGRDGLVRGAHAGFPGRASGSFHTAAKAELTRRVESLLAEPAARRTF